jgi:hypothetical protein
MVAGRRRVNIDDIKQLSARLLEDTSLGWADEPKLLAQTLGFPHVYVLKNRVSGKIRINLKDQVSMSEKLGMILRGEIICERRMFGGKITGFVVTPANPKPLGWKPGVRCAVGLTSRGVKLSICPS